jgi:DNA replication protein DnaC
MLQFIIKTKKEGRHMSSILALKCNTASIEIEGRSCDVHGSYEAKNYLGRLWSKCPHCAEEAQERKNKNEELIARKERRRAWESKIGRAGIPDRFKEKTLDTFVADTRDKKNALDFAKHYAVNFSANLESGKGAIFMGSPGTGKTHLAAGIAISIMGAEERSALYISAMRAIRKVKESWGHGAKQTESEVIASMVYPDLLIVDEIGVQSGSDFEKNLLFDILNERYEKRKPTILISNLTKEEVIGFVGERVMDRMKEDGGMALIFNWESHRGC